ncbi:MAG: hypothetical protein IJX93_00520 [Clostridia bacterium]|nr:hypothetical protein [Clostridia bacterium]MBQ8368593.1 hypothetical protein [Clostridia bacterium]MBQ8512108.1 hypothetical protein [Clostridia bacterium]
MNTRMDRSRLNIGVYHLREYARTERHVKELRECGVDFVICLNDDKPTLDLFAKYGVGAIVTGVVPGWWGGDGHNAGTMAEVNPLAKYDECAAAFTDHPAVWGIDIGDEPSALDFPHYGRVYDRVNTLFPKQFPYLNLYPNYASVAENSASQTVNQLGTPTYAEHIERYCQCVPADYLCYDFYLYAINVPKAYENLRIVADACLRTGRSMWIVLQVNSNRAHKWITENGLRFQAYTAMAFGAENITWACYTAGWWHNQVLDENGEKTEQYDKLKTVNAELHTIGEEYMKYRRTSTHFVSFDGTDWMSGVGQESSSALSTGVFTAVTADDPVVIGEMVSRSDDSRALMIASAGDPYDQNPGDVTVTFRCCGRKITAIGGNGLLPVENCDGKYKVTFPKNGGVLITAR